jgi:ADP-ribose pyrophosphatase YjhB (NUDIX family)
MPIERNYCAQCGKPLATQVLHDRPRLICSACDTIYYENPLPVAASILLNEQREVLLVKRRNEPHKGEWCLPMGFAELGETIADAARRELKEETGVQALVLRLIAADSFESGHYGDLLIVTFEMQKVEGEEQAGDDAEEVRYFPIKEPPPLAFSSNETALRACVVVHEEGWAIQDSFVTLHANEDREMLSDVLVAVIQERAEEIAGLWLMEVRTNPTTRSYRTLEPDQLMERATAAISQFGRWLKGDEASNEVKSFYRLLAKERKEQGFGVHELLSSLMLLKRQLWKFAHSLGMWERPIDMYRVLELNRRVAAFFDKATYHAARGFEADTPT